MKGQQIPFTHLEERTKSVEGFRRKIVRSGRLYSDPFKEITDLCGVRVILRRTSDADRVIELLRAEFIVDNQSSIHKAEQLEVDQFGYTSVHLVVSAKPERATLPEWSSIADLKIEVQVRTILQHAWATISHTYDYKVEADVPQELRRGLFRLSALVELADEELDRFATEIERTIEKYRASLETGNKQIELNVDSLRAFVETSPIVEYWNKYLGTVVRGASAGMGDLSRDLRIASFCGVTSLEQIESILSGAKGWGERFFEEFYKEFFETRGTRADLVSVVKNAPVTSLLIATHAERFTPEILIKQFGWGTTHILDVAAGTRLFRNQMKTGAQKASDTQK